MYGRSLDDLEEKIEEDNADHVDWRDSNYYYFIYIYKRGTPPVDCRNELNSNLATYPNELIYRSFDLSFYETICIDKL